MLQYLSGHLKKLKFDRHDTESCLFYLQYRVTCLLLMVCCIAVTSNLFAGEPIVCTDANDVNQKVMASYCWSHSTYSVKDAYKKTPGHDIPHPGIDTSEDKAEFIYRDYYQWVYLVLFMQGIFFYLPHCIWKCLEDGKIDQLCKIVANPPSMQMQVGEEENTMTHEEKLNATANFFYHRFGWHNKYALAYWFCEFLAWLNILLQAYFLDIFFQEEFLPLGLKAFDYFKADRQYDNNPLTWVFPRVAKCHFHKFGPQTLVETVDVLCVLPINALSEKIYLMLWGWFLLLFIMSSVGIVMTILSIIFPSIRGVRLSFTIASVLGPKSSEIGNLANYVGKHSDYGDWFILRVLARKMDIMDYTMFLNHLKYEISFSNTKEKYSKEFKIGSTEV